MSYVFYCYGASNTGEILQNFGSKMRHTYSGIKSVVSYLLPLQHHLRLYNIIKKIKWLAYYYTITYFISRCWQLRTFSLFTVNEVREKITAEEQEKMLCSAVPIHWCKPVY
jgi:phosphotransferase system  glucose/maltose/N-acetylglucosamine-specific IIC component